MKKFLKKIFRKLALEITEYRPKNNEKSIVSLKPDNGNEGNVLLSYILEPFLLEDGEGVSNEHTHDWESLLIARTFLSLGYRVDVIDYRNKNYVPIKDYAIFVSARTNFQRIAGRLNEDCLKIVHLDTAHWLFNNYATYSRSLNLQKRRGLTITRMSQRIVEPNLAIEHADFAVVLGNKFTVSTYSYAKKPIFPISVPTCSIYSWPEGKDYEACRRHFLWLGSSGLLHKGLDLALEAFVEMPDCHLTICGPVCNEKHFENAYYKELYKTPNIHTLGWVDVHSSKFIETVDNCVGLIYPSSSEGQSGAVATCLQAGLIPIISYQSGLDVDDFGVILKDCSINEIQNSVRMVAGFSEKTLKQMSRKAWKKARRTHTKERYSENYKKTIAKILRAGKKSGEFASN